MEMTKGRRKAWGEEVPYPTSGVVEGHLTGKGGYEFFNKIAATFGYSREDVGEFYNKVFFANYIPVLCGRKNNMAADFISKNRTDYNNDLFEFVNQYSINTIVCYSRTSYNALPGLGEGETAIDKPIGQIAGKNNLAGVCNYINGVKHKYCAIELKRPLIVYGLWHPSCKGGFSIQQVYDFFKAREDTAVRGVMR